MSEDQSQRNRYTSKKKVKDFPTNGWKLKFALLFSLKFRLNISLTSIKSATNDSTARLKKLFNYFLASIYFWKMCSFKCYVTILSLSSLDFKFQFQIYFLQKEKTNTFHFVFLIRIVTKSDACKSKCWKCQEQK